MPTYEYRCKDCGHQLEAQQSFTDAPLTDCPSCGGALKKKFSAVGIAFKGSGFYKTDSRSSSSASSPPASSGSSGGSDTTTSSSSGSTSATSATSATTSSSDTKPAAASA